MFIYHIAKHRSTSSETLFTILLLKSQLISNIKCVCLNISCACLKIFIEKKTYIRLFDKKDIQYNNVENSFKTGICKQTINNEKYKS